MWQKRVVDLKNIKKSLLFVCGQYPAEKEIKARQWFPEIKGEGVHDIKRQHGQRLHHRGIQT